MKNLKTLFLGLFVLLANTSFAETTNNSTKSTAQLAAVCNINAQNISFGTLALPIGSQNASATLSVTCTKSSPYSITMGTLSNIWLVVANGTSIWYGYNASTDTRIDLPTAGCGTQTGGQCATSGGYTSYGAASGSSQLCTFPRGCTVYKTGSNYGTLLGISKNDSISYFIKHPDNSSLAWNSTNSYSNTGTGTNQNIPVVAQLIPGQSVAYPAPDNYLDTITTQITF